MYPFERAAPPPPLPEVLVSAFEARAAAKTLELPVLPEAAAAILSETARPEWSAARVVDALKRDASLAGHLLRLANSPAFRGASAAVSIQQAVTRLGASHLRQLALVIACETRAFAAPGFEAEVRALFRHSLAVALCAKEIARQRRANVETAFLAGLLHDIGWPVVLHAVLELGHGQAPPHRDAVLGFAELRHAAVGAAVARAWGLAEAVALGIEAHHQARPGDELTATLALADALAWRGSGGDFSDERLQTLPATQALNLYPDAVAGLAALSPTLWDEAARW